MIIATNKLKTRTPSGNVIRLRILKFGFPVPLLFKEGTMKNDAKHVFHRGWLMIVINEPN